MPSESLRRWNAERIPALDEIEDAHESVGGSERGRRYAAQQINYAYAAILSAQFQAFCRDLHSESIDYLVTVVPAGLQDVPVDMLLLAAPDRSAEVREGVLCLLKSYPRDERIPLAVQHLCNDAGARIRICAAGVLWAQRGEYTPIRGLIEEAIRSGERDVIVLGCQLLAEGAVG
jgi:hypothetical protein